MVDSPNPIDRLTSTAQADVREAIIRAVNDFLATQDSAAIQLPVIQFLANRDDLLAEAIAAALTLPTSHTQVTDGAKGVCAASPDHADILETIENAADDWQKLGYTSALAEVRDMANVGRALMDALPKGCSCMNCPSEIVSDLQNERDEALAATPPVPAISGEVEKLREALQAQEDAEDSRDTCVDCDGDGQWEHCPICSLAFGDAIDLRRAVLAAAPTGNADAESGS